MLSHESVDFSEMHREIMSIRWTISDTGIGMSKAFLDHIFEPFVQERSDARSTYNGSGLGMSIAKSWWSRWAAPFPFPAKWGRGPHS